MTTCLMICILLLKFQKKSRKKMKSKRKSGGKERKSWPKLQKSLRDYLKSKLTNLFENNWVMTLITNTKMKKLMKMVDLEYLVLKNRLI